MCRSPDGARSRSSWISTIVRSSSRVSRWKTIKSSIRLRNSGRKWLRTASMTRSSDDLVTPGRANALRAQVGGHDQHHIGEVDRATLAVGEPAVVEQLEEDVEDVWMRLLHLVEQDHGIGAATHRLGELAPLVVAHVAGRSADEAADRDASPCTRTCRCGPSPARRRRGIRPGPAASSVLPTPVGPRNRKDPIGRCGSASPARLLRTELATAVTAWCWPTTRRWSCSSRWISFSVSPCINFDTGIPVQRATTSATSCSVTSSESIRPSAWSFSNSASCSSSWSQAGAVP